MPANKYSSRTVYCYLPTAASRGRAAAAQSASESDRLEKLERAVEQLQKRNAELEAEVSSLKTKQTAVVPEGKMKTKIISEGKTYVEKVVEEKLPFYVQQRGPELKLVLGGFIQVNFEDGDVFALKDSLVRPRSKTVSAAPGTVNLTGDFAEQFDFKMEGDFGQSDGTQDNRTAFSGNRYLGQLASVSCGANQNRPI